LARGAEDDARAATDLDTFAGHAEDASRNRTIAVVGFAAGGALVAAGIVRYALRPAAGRAAVTATVGPGGQGFLSVSGSF
jgi:hypothetical protein